jgi:hypothetical protein
MEHVCLWSFFGFGHGKGHHDGVGAVVKRFIKQVQLDTQGPQLQNVEHVVILLHEHLSQWPKTSYSRDDN